MSATTTSPVAVLLADPGRHLAGTDLRVHLPIGRALLNEILAARPADTPVEELYADPDEDNRLHLHLTATAPVVGRVRRRITFVPGPAVSFPDQPWLHLSIADGFKFFDKPLIGLMQGQIEQRLPEGVEFTAQHLRLHLPALLRRAGYQALVPLIHRLQLRSEPNQLILDLIIKADD